MNRKLAAAVLLTTSGLSFTPTTRADAPVFFGELLRPSYEKSPCDLWNQECAGYPTTWRLKTTGFRFGIGRDAIRISYFDLRRYRIHAKAADDEDGAMACRCQVAGAAHWYDTKGSIRGFALTGRGAWRGFFLEGGPTWNRQAFELVKDDGYSYRERLWGLGYMAGLGYEHRSFSLGLYTYQSTVAGKFNHSEFPAGVGGAYVLSMGYAFK